MLVSQSAKAFKCISKPQLFIVTELSIFRHKLLNEQLFGMTALFLEGMEWKLSSTFNVCLCQVNRWNQYCFHPFHPSALRYEHLKPVFKPAPDACVSNLGEPPSSLSDNSVTISYFRHVLMKNILHHTHFDSEVTLLKSVQQSGKPGLEH